MKVSKLKLGVFVILSITLLVVMLFALGMAERFSQKGYLVTFFADSIQGLDVGSPVKYKGVPVGRVDAIYIETVTKNIRVDMEIDLKAFSVNPNGDGAMSLTGFYEFCRNERELGLRCRLEYAGLTGLKYVELNYFEDPGKILPIDKTVGEYFYVPSMQSTLTDVLGKFNRSLDNIAQIDFNQLSEQISLSLQNFSELVTDKEIKDSISRLNKVAENLENVSAVMAGVITEESLTNLSDQLSATMHEIQSLSQELGAKVEEAKIGDTTASIRKGTVAFDRLQREISITLDKLNNALSGIETLSEELSNEPNSIIFGKSSQPLDQ